MQVSLSDLQRDYKWLRSQTSWASDSVAANNSRLCTLDIKLEVLQARLQRQYERQLELQSEVERLAERVRELEGKERQACLHSLD